MRQTCFVAGDNLLLWSHYADVHQGVAFQFECIKELDVPLLVANPVTYSSEPPAMATVDEWLHAMLGLRAFDPTKDIWHRLTHTKSDIWKEEKEWRVVTYARPNETGTFSDTPFYPREISRILLGCKILEEDKNDFLKLATGPFAHVEVFRAYQKPRSYGLDFRRIK
jgi:hypothetical protein